MKQWAKSEELSSVLTQRDRKFDPPRLGKQHPVLIMVAKRIVMGQSLPYFGNKHPFCSYFGVPGYQIFDYIHWVGLRENSQETTFILSSLGFSLTPILGNVRAGRLL